jgi:ribosomal protein L11 methyltransferase
VPHTTEADWVTIRAFVPTDEVDVAVAALWDAGVAGIEERTAAPATGGPTPRVELLAGAPAEAAGAALTAVAHRWPAEAVPVHGDQWLDTWRDWARAWRAGSRLVVVPAWLEVPAWVGADDVVVHLDPGRAFGSGAHATTRLCLAELEARVAPGATVLDVGCGSGVLAVAAARLGAETVDAIDIDPEAVAATTANAEANEVGGSVHATPTPLGRITGTYDVVVANIGAATLRAMAPDLVRTCRPGGTIVVSGVLAEQADAVGAALAEAGARAAGGAADGEWRALVATRA